MVSIKVFMNEASPLLIVQPKPKHVLVIKPMSLEAEYQKNDTFENREDVLSLLVFKNEAQNFYTYIQIPLSQLFHDEIDDSFSVYTSLYYVKCTLGSETKTRTWWWWSPEPIEPCTEEVSEEMFQQRNLIPEGLQLFVNAVEMLDDSVFCETTPFASVSRELSTLALCPTTEKRDLLDGKAYVKLLLASPGLYPEGLTPEYIIVRSARISTNGPLTKGIKLDGQLIRFLWRHQHTSPFEQMSFTFELHIPIFVRTHFLRHRTAKLNEESQRYTKVQDEVFNPLQFEIRGNNKANKQSSSLIQITPELEEKFNEANRLTQLTFELYEQLLEAGVSREIARSYLPLGTYTTIIYQMDLRNLLHLFTVRCDPGAQKECQEIAQAMLDLIRPICPVTIAAWEESKRNLVLTNEEMAYLTSGTAFVSKTQEAEFQTKLERYPEFFARFNAE